MISVEWDTSLAFINRMTILKGRIISWLNVMVFGSSQRYVDVLGRGYILLKLSSEHDFDKGCVGYNPS